MVSGMGMSSERKAKERQDARLEMSKRMWRSSRPAVETEGRRGMFDVAYGAVSEKQRFDLWLPDEGDGPFPVIVSVHGGGFAFGDKRDGEMIGPMLTGLERGYAVAGVNYRLSDEGHFPEPVRDVKQCIRYLRVHAAELKIDPSRMVLWGGSAGGYLALMAALDTETGAAGCVVWYPLVDVTAAEHQLKVNSVMRRFLYGPARDVSPEYCEAFPVKEENEFPFYEWEDGMYRRLLGPGEPDGRPADAKQYLHRGMPPLFLQHGSRDEIVPMQQSIELALAAEEIAGPGWGKLELIPEAIHSSVMFETAENLEKVFSFIRQCTK